MNEPSTEHYWKAIELIQLGDQYQRHAEESRLMRTYFVPGIPENFVARASEIVALGPEGVTDALFAVTHLAAFLLLWVAQARDISENDVLELLRELVTGGIGDEIEDEL